MSSVLTKAEINELVKWVKTLPKFTSSIPYFSVGVFIKNLNDLKYLYLLIGRSLDRYYNHTDSPYFEQEEILPEYITDVIKAGVSRYSQWSLMLFEAEHYLRKESKKYGIKYTTRLEALKEISREESEYLLFFISQVHSETPTGREIYNYQQRFTNNKFKADEAEHEIKNAEYLTFTNYCAEIFWLYRDKCPSYGAWALSMGFPPNKKVMSLRKIVVVNGVIQESKAANRKKKASETLREKVDFARLSQG